MFRQGDVYGMPVSAVPPEARPFHSRVLVRGEATGHSHRLSGDGIEAVFRTWSEDADHPGEVFFVQIGRAGAELLHDEHHPIPLAEGIVRIWRQREYHPREIRTVID
jgi:hypothetical protein